MALTYTEIAEEKSARIWIFFIVVLFFYFFIAFMLGNITKAFFVFSMNSEALRKTSNPFMGLKELLYLFIFSFVAAIFHIIYSTSNASFFITNNLKAAGIDASDAYHQRFKTIVDEVNVATGNKYKITPIIIPTFAMNAFAVSDKNKNAVVGVTEGLLSKLNRQQLEAVVAHECGHIVSGDSLQTTVGCALFGIYAAMLAGIGRILKQGRIRSSGKGGGGVILFLLIIYAVLSVMQIFYDMIRMLISRDRELRADAIAVKLTRDPLSLSEALYAISRGWRGLGYIDRNLESLFIINPSREPIDEKEGFISDLFSTHPPIAKRISILAAMAHEDVNNIKEKIHNQEKAKSASRNQAVENDGLAQVFQISALHSTGSDIKCPKCDQSLISCEYEGAKIERCQGCQGALVDNDKIQRLIIRQEKGFSERVKKLAEIVQRDGLEKIRNNVRVGAIPHIKCPKCAKSMIRMFYTPAYLVEVDVCSFCNATWFDRDELEITQYLIESKKAS